MSDRAIRSVVVVGGGIVGLSAALAFRSALPEAVIAIVDIPPDPAALADRLPTAWPSVAQFHALIGLDEIDLVRRGIAVHHVGTVFDNWPTRKRWFHGFGPHGKPVGAVRFDQIWLQARNAGDARPYHQYSAAEVLTRADKFIHPPGGADSLMGSYQYGLRLDPELYRECLRDRAAASGIRIIETALERIDRTGGRVCGLALRGGMRVEADFFVDCSGPAGLVITENDDGFEGWPSHAAHQLSIDAADAGTPSPAERVTGTDSGWVAYFPLRRRTIRCVANADGEFAVRRGRRTRPWAENVLALGDAGVAVDPLYGLNLALVHRAIFLALELLPSREFNPLELTEFNRRWLLITDQVRDLIALLYMRNGTEIPESLHRRIDQYQHRGRLPYQEDEVLNHDDWTSALIGMGRIPRNVDPAAAGVPLDRATDAMNKIAGELAEFAARAPAYPDYLARITSAP